MESLRGKNALVTGAAKRIGRSIALRLASEGANIVLHYNASSGEADSVRREAEKYNVTCWPLRADLGSADDYGSLVDTAMEKAGGLDILVNNASIYPESTVESITWEDLSRSMEINAWAPFCISRAFARRAGRGSIVNLLDTRTGGFDLKHVAYLLSKQVLESLTRLTALEFAPDIRVNGVAPGLIVAPAGKDDRYLEELARGLPLKRHGDVRDIADAVMFLVANEFITGQVLHVDGGWSLRAAKGR